MINQIRSTNAYILNGNIGVSYNTPIAANVEGVTFITENYYSNTTAHHKTEIIREFNNPVIEVNQEIIRDLHQKLTYGYYADAAIIARETIEEQEQKNQLKRCISGNSINCIKEHQALLTNRQLIESERIDYKNRNYKEIRIYKTTFNNVSNIYYKETRHYKIRPGSEKDKRPYYNCKPRLTIIRS